MRRTLTLTLASASAAVLLVSSRAGAQVDVNPPLPNVLLLVDTSGSMEYKVDGTKVTCEHVDATLPNDPLGASDKSRWTQLTEVLTGDVQNYACYTQDRKSVTFRDEYKLGASLPPDYNYQFPYHRILSASCTIGSGVADANPFAWGTTPFRYHPWDNAAGTCAGVTRAQTGLLDSYRDRVRFGLMTFDTQTDAGTGVTPAKVADYASGTTGTWSYFLDYVSSPSCGGNTSCAKGKPDECPTLQTIEVGARNAAAPPWEGRLVPFGSPTAPIADVHLQTDRIKEELLAVRPFGATPINGMLYDAENFLTLDASGDPIGGTTCDPVTGEGCFGPRYDPYILSSQHCRKSFVILLTDGEPNLDLRPSCEGVTPPNPGQCPFPKRPEEIVLDLAQSPTAPIKTFVIGFALSTWTVTGLGTIDCSAISLPGPKKEDPGTFDPNGYCTAGTMKDELKTCCTLAKMAFNGGTTNAHFATNAQELRTALAAILDEIASASTTRTLPVFGSSPSASGGSYTFFSSFLVASGEMWKGQLTRKRTVCEKVTGPGGTTTVEPVTKDVDAAAADDFAHNVNTAASDPTRPRHYYTVLSDPDPSLSAGSVRPGVTADDGAGFPQAGLVKDGLDADFPGKVPGSAMAVSTASCPAAMNATSADNCAEHFMKWEIGATDGTLPNRGGNVFADIYHGTPVLVGPPSASLRDESYTAFTAAKAGRPIMLYAPTNDGQLHAFKVAASPADATDTFKVETWPAQNELWSFFPPAVLHRIPSQYPSTHQVLLDGPPVVADVVFTRDSASAESGGSAADWHTVLVAGFGAAGSGYYAIDITDPTTGPRMLWQLTTDAAGKRLFGEHTGVPTITTLYFDPAVGGTNPKQYAVAILPGGESAGPTGTDATQNGLDTYLPPTPYKPRPKVQAWTPDAARSVTVVMLETGRIVRTFRDKDTPSSINEVAKDAAQVYAALDAPMTGQAVVFPAGEGAVADRAFLGDGDGMLWRVDLSAASPRDWRIDLWFDAFSVEATPPLPWKAGQPIVTAPVLSVDRLGALTVAFSTGDQETFTPGAIKNYLWSLRENPQTFHSEVLWYNEFTNGQRVSGPMVLYGSVLYFTTLTPTPSSDTNRCSAGSSKLCGEHYMNQKTLNVALDGGEAMLPDPPGTANLVQCVNLPGIAFGPAIQQQPTCSETETYDDPYLGWGTHTRMHGGVTGGKSSLVVTTTNTAVGATPLEYQLPSPTNTTRIDSWAAVIE